MVVLPCPRPILAAVGTESLLRWGGGFPHRGTEVPCGATSLASFLPKGTEDLGLLEEWQLLARNATDMPDQGEWGARLAPWWSGGQALRGGWGIIPRQEPGLSQRGGEHSFHLEGLLPQQGALAFLSQPIGLS